MTVTRFAPSPTGYIHVGNLRTALMNYLIAKKAGGKFILRIDDTDPERSKEEYVDQIQRDLEWLGLEWDVMERQSLRLDRYAEAADKLRDMGRFYEAFETPTELDLKRKKQLNMGKPPVYDRAALALSEAEKDALRAERGDGVWRFKLDHQRIEWTDGVLGDISIDAASVSDPVLIRADGQVLYTIASIVDDTEMGVTNVVRGSDHVTNTATQIQMIQALGGTVPAFAHHSLLTGPQGEALSKRLGTLAIKDLRWDLFGQNRRRDFQPQGGKAGGFREGRAKFQPGFRKGGFDPAPLASTKSSMLVAAGDGADGRLREAVILASLIRTPELLLEFDSQLERMECSDFERTQIRDLLLDCCDTNQLGDVEGRVFDALGPYALESLFGLPHVAIAPSVRRAGDLETVRMSLAEEFAKLQADKGLNAEIEEAEEELAVSEDDTLTRRLHQAAETKNRALRSEQEDRAHYDVGDNGARINRDERDAFDAILDKINFSRR